MAVQKSNVIRLYDVKPEMALEHLKRSTGLDFEQMPQSLARLVDVNQEDALDDLDATPPVLTDIVELA